MDRIQFYAFSADKRVGTGRGDNVIDVSIYEELNSITHWRRIFSSLWTNLEEPFVYNGLKYISYEHALQSAKFLCNGYKAVAKRFSLDDETSMLARQNGQIAFKNRKLQVLTSEELETWRTIQGTTKDGLYMAKFSQVKTAKSALLATGDVELWNKGPRIKEIRCIRLENTRNKIRNTD